MLRHPEQYKLLLSTASLFDANTALYTVMAPLEAMTVDADPDNKDHVFDGIEYVPLSNQSLSSWQIWSGLVSPQAKRAIISGHEGLRGEKTMRQSLQVHGRLEGLARWALVPYNHDSLGILHRAQQVVGRPLSVVHIPTKEHDRATTLSFGGKTFQPTPEVMVRWGVTSTASLKIEAEKKGFTGATIDIFHSNQKARPEAGEQFDLYPLYKNLPEVWDFVEEVHVRIGYDANPDQGWKDWVDLVNDNRHSEYVRNLRTIGQLQRAYPRPNLRIVVEVPARLWSARNKRSQRFLPPAVLRQELNAVGKATHHALQG